MVNHLKKMQLDAKVEGKDKRTLRIVAPCTRSDIIHACDVMEDVAIAYGYNNIRKTVPNVGTTSLQFPLNHLSDLLRGGVAECGFSEVLTWALCSKAENWSSLNVRDPRTIAVELENPK